MLRAIVTSRTQGCQMVYIFTHHLDVKFFVCWKHRSCENEVRSTRNSLGYELRSKRYHSWILPLIIFSNSDILVLCRVETHYILYLLFLPKGGRKHDSAGFFLSEQKTYHKNLIKNILGFLYSYLFIKLKKDKEEFSIYRQQIMTFKKEK